VTPKLTPGDPGAPRFSPSTHDSQVYTRRIYTVWTLRDERTIRERGFLDE
jgi:hypothetical protein